MQQLDARTCSVKSASPIEHLEQWLYHNVFAISSCCLVAKKKKKKRILIHPNN